MKLCNEKVYSDLNCNIGNQYYRNNKADKFVTITGSEFISEYSKGIGIEIKNQ